MILIPASLTSEEGKQETEHATMKCSAGCRPPMCLQATIASTTYGEGEKEETDEMESMEQTERMG